MTAQQDNPLDKLGIIAGGGSLPARLVASAQSFGREVFVVRLEGHADDKALDNVPGATVRVGAAGEILRLLKKAGCKDLVLAGKVDRPSLSSIRPDLKGAKLLMKLGMKSLGDDGLLRLIGKELEKEGFRLIGAHEVLGEVGVESGVLGAVQPDKQGLADVKHGLKVARILGQADVGQGCVVQEGLVLALEAIEGTNEMVQRSCKYRRPGAGGVLVKAAKPQQDRRLDLPAIGMTTLLEAHNAGLRGIGLLAGGTMIIDKEEVLQKADELGIFIIGLTSEDENENETVL